jgi:hypothetical protein
LLTQVALQSIYLIFLLDILVFGQAKIPYFYHFLREKDVLGLQIPMYNSFAVDASHAVN